MKIQQKRQWLCLVLCMAGLFSVKGQTYVNQAARVVWNFNTATDYDKANTVTPEAGFSMMTVNLGDLEMTGTGTGQAVDAGGNKVNFIKLKPSGDTKAVEWVVKPAKGLVFTPTRLSAYIARFGTDAENGVVVTAVLPDGCTEALGTYTAPRNNKVQAEDKYGTNENYTNQFVIELTEEQQQTLSSADAFTLQATLGVNSTKEGGFSDVCIEGLLNGTVIAVPQYTLTAKASPAEGGSITLNPKADEYDEGSEVKIRADKQFGYRFVRWTDASGKEISTEAQFVYTVTENVELIAHFEKVNTYELSCTLEGGANPYMLRYSPEPRLVDGKNMYEEGTEVRLSATSNKIMTFVYWSNNETSAEIVLPMYEDISLTAYYAAIDYIAAWDFIVPGNNGRVADYASPDNDAATLVLRNAAGESQAWLDKSWQAAGGYEGRNAAVNWRTDGELGDYYWQTKLNAESFTDIKVSNAMAYNFNAYTKYELQYSLNGNDWDSVGCFQIEGSKNWKEEEFSLPSAANNQKELYLRWIADKSSPIMGTSSVNDGIALSDIFVTATARLVDDGKAPVLLSTVPAEGNTTASANGKISLRFDEKIKVTETAQARLGTVVLNPIVSGTTLLFEYKGLDYAQAYTFTLPANTVSDLSGNFITEDIVIHFSTKTRPPVAKGAFDFIVPDDGTFREAVAAAAKRDDKSKRYRIFVRQGAYTIEANQSVSILGSDEKNYPDPATEISSPNLSIIGEGMEITSLVNTVPEVSVGSNPIEGLGKAENLSLQSSATGTYIQDITIKNGLHDATGRGAALEDASNKTICKNVCLYGYQDTYLSNNENGRFYFEGGVLRGRTDFLCGKGDVYYNAVNLVMCEKGGYITAPSRPAKYGYIFKDCVISGEGSDINGNFTLGRPWGSGTPTALFIDTKMEAQPSAIGWNEMSGGYPARFAEYNSTTSSGTLVDLSNRKITFGDGFSNNPVLTAEEAAQMTISKVMGASDDWDPTYYTEQASAPTGLRLEATSLSWNNNDYVFCWAVCKDGKVVAFTTEPIYALDDVTASWSVRAANEMGGLSEASSLTTALETPKSSATVVSVRYFTPSGLELTAPSEGLNMVLRRYSDGSVSGDKIIVESNQR